MTTAAAAPNTEREPELLGQTVVVIGGSAGIGLETARRARVEGADVVLTGRSPPGAPTTRRWPKWTSTRRAARSGHQTGEVRHGYELVLPCSSSIRASAGAEKSSGTQGMREASHIPPR